MEKKLILTMVVVITLSFFLTSCNRRTFGHSVSTIVAASGDQYLLKSSCSLEDMGGGQLRSTNNDPGAIFVVGVKEGAELGGNHFGHGSIVLIEGTKEAPTFRIAQFYDRIELPYEITILGRKYNKGKLTVPADGKLIH